MPPEQAAGKEIDAAADVYSLGAMLYAMVTGRPPFEGSSQLETIFQVLQDEPVAPRKTDRKIPRDLEAICLKCLEKNAADRYRTATELAADLQRFLSGEPIQAKNDLRRRLRKWTIREPVLVAHLAATLILLVVMCIGYWIWQDNNIGPEYNFLVLKGNVAILIVWALAVLVLQKSQNMLQTQSVIPLAWAAINPVFLTITLYWNGWDGWRPEPGTLESLGWLFSLYFLLNISCCFFRRVEIIAVSTLVSLIGYSALMFFGFGWPNCDAPSYKLVFGVNMAGTGALLCLLTLRMKRLGEQNTT
jgi:hypothetical protein